MLSSPVESDEIATLQTNKGRRMAVNTKPYPCVHGQRSGILLNRWKDCLALNQTHPTNVGL
tara:strand:- start:1131 stop:1313 length:183 start_codon:yes stop_codon:yes gene_type:complete